LRAGDQAGDIDIEVGKDCGDLTDDAGPVLAEQFDLERGAGLCGLGVLGGHERDA